jgi:hypothetical protein
VAVYVGKPGGIDKIGYHAHVTSGRADGNEKVIELEPFSWMNEPNPSDRPYEFIACLVEPVGAFNERFPLFAICPRSMFSPGFCYPRQREYGYFGCWNFRGLFRPNYSPPLPSFAQPRGPDESGPLDVANRLQGLPEMRRAPPPFDGIGR